MSTTALRGTSPRTPNKKGARPSPPPYHRVDVPTNHEPDTDENDDASWSTTTSTSNQENNGGETKYNNNELHNTVESSKSEAPSASLKDASSHNVPDRNPDPSTGMHRSYGVRLRRSRSGMGRPIAAAAAASVTTTTPSRVRTRIRPRRFVRMDRPPVRPRTSHVLVSTLPTEEDRQEQSAASTVRMKDIWTSRGIGIPQNANIPSSPATPASATHSSHGHGHGHGHSRKHSHGHASKSPTHTPTSTSTHDTNRKKENQVDDSDTKWRSLLEQERANNALLQSRIDGLTQLVNLYQAQLLASHESHANNSSSSSAPQEEDHQQQCPVHHPSNNLKCTCTPTDHETNTNNTHPDNIFI